MVDIIMETTGATENDFSPAADALEEIGFIVGQKLMEKYEFYKVSKSFNTLYNLLLQFVLFIWFWYLLSIFFFVWTYHSIFFYQRTISRLTRDRDRPRFEEMISGPHYCKDTEIIRYICKDFWLLVFKKNADGLRTNSGPYPKVLLHFNFVYYSLWVNLFTKRLDH